MTDSFDIRNSAFGISPARRLAVMNLALRGIEADFGPEHADTFRRDLHPDLRADYVLAKAKEFVKRGAEVYATAQSCYEK
jgi:hypothetical protein